MQLRTRATLRGTLMWAMGLFTAAYVAGLAVYGEVPRSAVQGWFGIVVDNWLGLLTVWAPAAVCWLAASRAGTRRPEVLLAAAAVTSYAAGDTYFVVATLFTGELPFPSPADVGYLAVYPLLVAALVVAVHRNIRGRATTVWLDGAVGSLGATSVLAVLLSQVLASASQEPPSLATAVAVANPLFDLLLVAAVAGIAALGDVRMGGRWALLAGGLLVFAAADVIYALQVTGGAYAMGTPLDAGWAIGLALIALWVDSAARLERRQASSGRSRANVGGTALTVSTVSTVAGLGVLVANSHMSVSVLASSLAAVTLLAAAARSQLAFRRLAAMADQRRRAAATDELTGLPNRRALYATGRERLHSPGRPQALLMLDLDKFKEVNDALGHHTGDQLLIQVGTRLRAHLRPGDVLARLGGDEFAILIEDADHARAADVAARLCSALAEPFTVKGVKLHTSISAGVALFPQDGPDLSTLLRKADIAMYKAKASRAGQHVYCADDDADATTRLQTVEDLHTALSTGQFVLHYQPKVDLATAAVHDVEALVRWNHPTRGLVYPDDFLHLVEESGLMPSLTRVVLAMALDQAAEWARADRGLTVAVNLSASFLTDSDLPRQIASMLAARDLSPGALQLEITEEFVMADRERACAILTRLRNSGVQISVDDFGTGYSSLSYLRDLPIDELKLDHSFSSPGVENERAAALIASTISLAHSLGLRMVAEGVETDATYAKLAALGCDQAQGYYISRPVPPSDLDSWLDGWLESHPMPRARTDLAVVRLT